MFETKLGTSCNQNFITFKNDRQIDVELFESIKTVQTDSRICFESIGEKITVLLVIILSNEPSINWRLNQIPKTRQNFTQIRSPCSTGLT